MLKKILLLLIIIIILIMTFFYFNGGLETLTKYFRNETLFINTTTNVELENKNSKILLKQDGFYNIFENSIEYYNYDGNLIKKDDFESFINNVYIGSEKIIETEDNLLYSLDNHELLNLDSESKKILSIVEDGYIFDINSDLSDLKNYLYVYNTNKDLLGSFEFDKEKVIHARKSLNSNSVIVVTFNFDGNTIKSSIMEYLVDSSFEIWKTDFMDELVLFIEPIKDGIYLATDKNIYKLNNKGKILWKYGGYINLKDFKIIQNNIVILEGKEETKLHIIDTDGKLLKKIETNDSYTKINQYSDFIIINGTKYIAYIKDNKFIVLYNSTDIIKELALYNDMLRINFQNQITSYKIGIK